MSADMSMASQSVHCAKVSRAAYIAVGKSTNLSELNTVLADLLHSGNEVVDMLVQGGLRR